MSNLPLVSVESAAEKLGVSVRRVQQFCEKGRLGQKVGQVYVISEGELRSFAKKERNPGRPKTSAKR